MGIHDREYYQDEPPGLRLDLRQQSIITILIVVNIGVFLANLFTTSLDNPHWLMRSLATHPSYLTQPLQWWHFLSSGFAHDPTNGWHLLFNMAGLFFLGRDVEARMGRREFLAFYLVVLVLSAVISAVRYQLLVPPAQWRGGWGASGAVVAVVILYAFYFPKRQLLVMFVLPMPAWAVAVMFVLLDMFGIGPVENVAHDVHLAGAALGAAYYLSGVRLTNWWPKRVGKRKPKLRVLRADNDADLEREGDRLLEKVHREGEESLTARERKVLEKYSRLMRQRHGD